MPPTVPTDPVLRREPAPLPVIIFRYLARDLLATTAAVATVLLLVVMSSRFVQYMADAAEGKIDPNVIFAIMGYRMPAFSNSFCRWRSFSPCCCPTAGCTRTAR